MQGTGIFGGSFNPIHNGHIALAKTLLNVTGLDEIWFMVSPQNPLKQQAGLLDDTTRLEMARTALTGEPQLAACDYKFYLTRPSYTWSTLQHLSHDYPDRRFTLIIGADNWKMFGRWYRHEDILRHHDVVIYPRHGSIVDQVELPAGVTLASTPLFDISSTEIRRRVTCGESIDGLVPDVIKQDVKRHYGISKT
ncbi:nicotinate (nicotinamide) nucleotide adenylyltransferase [Xylanibacter rodentium]|uniref:nicotinate (nicotinamide) nucleotide adenylyltransferase n=1 Tax=Xylanibacter rodentium TaxID=2736289 RepID=UPI00259187E1|nr:nicotinate (nicotinamide) nucleotide adenylyltransferase [Xylanibacter rodentium]